MQTQEHNPASYCLAEMAFHNLHKKTEHTALLEGKMPVLASMPLSTKRIFVKWACHHHLPLVVSGNPTHVVMHSGEDRDGLLSDIHTSEDHGRL